MSASSHSDPRLTFPTSLRAAHRQLRNLLDRAIADAQASAAAWHASAARFLAELHDHHHAEDAFFFPALLASTRLTGAERTSFAGLDADHARLLTLAGRVERATDPQDALARLRAMATLSDAHFAAEEGLLDGPLLVRALSRARFAAIYRDMGRHWHTRRRE